MSKVGYKILKTLLRPVQKLPLGYHYFGGRVLTWLCEHVVHYRRDTVVTNLARSFPQKGYKEIEALTHDYYVHLGEIFAETLWFGGNTPDGSRLHDSHFTEVLNIEEFLRLWEANPHIMVLNSHVGNFETLGGFFQYVYSVDPKDMPIKEDNITVVYKKVQSELWDTFLAENRAAVLHGWCNYVDSKHILRFTLEHRDDPMVYIFDNDQFPYRGAKRHEIPSFMNQRTQAMAGGVTLARKLSFAVAYTVFDRISRGHYQLRFTTICEDASKMTEEEILLRYYSLLERDINANPANYLWSHKRWK